MRTLKTILAAAFILIVLVAVIRVAWNYDARQQENAGRLELLGTVDVRQVNLAFKVGGRLAAVNVEEGDRVEAGQRLASLEEADFEDEVRLALAELAGRKAELAKLEAGTRPEEIEQARSLVAQRRAALQFAEATFERQEKLAARDVASHQTHDEAHARLDEAAAQLRAAEQVLELAEIGPRQEDVRHARAQLDATRVALSIARRRLADAILIAPDHGVILTRVREPGAIVAAGETIVTMSLTTPVWARAYVDEPDLGRVHAGMRTEVRTDSGAAYRGQVGFISPVAEFTPKTVETRELRTSLVYRLRVIVENPDNRLKQGMPVTVLLQTGETENRP